MTSKRRAKHSVTLKAMPKAAAFLAKQLDDLPLEDKAMLINVNYPSIDRPKGINYLAVPNFHYWSWLYPSGEWGVAGELRISGDTSSEATPSRIGCPASGLYYGIALAGLLRCGQPSPFVLQALEVLGNNSGGCQTSTPQQAISVWRALGFSPTIYPREAAPSDSYYSRSEPQSREACRGICVWDNSVHAWWLKYASLAATSTRGFPSPGEQGKHQRGCLFSTTGTSRRLRARLTSAASINRSAPLSSERLSLRRQCRQWHRRNPPRKHRQRLACRDHKH